MFFKIIYTFAFLFITVFSTESESCSPKNAVNNAENEQKKMITGNFSGQLPTPGFLKLEIQKDGKALFLNVVTLHLPPAEIERFESKITQKDGKYCFAENPKTVEPCFVSVSDNEIVIRLSSDKKEISLKRIEEKTN